MMQSPKKMKEVIPHVIQKHLREARFCVPSKIESYDKTKRVASVTPSIGVYTDGGIYIELKTIQNVPCSFLGGQSLWIDIEYKKGDNVLLLFSDFGIGGWRASDGTTQERPDDMCSHELQNAFVMMGITTDNMNIEDAPSLKVDSNKNIEVQNGNGYIKLSSNGQIDLNGGLTIDP